MRWVDQSSPTAALVAHLVRDSSVPPVTGAEMADVDDVALVGNVVLDQPLSFPSIQILRINLVNSRGDRG
ncbi:MAG: hypothetical protein WAW85_04940 [Gordonia sp. (in: high G+C Gram-positive bacteria)]|uniref:hypothetical protein n=1 Tax=Gordonia sp. (in: high G+C Gram-positive bacteria) TaxID=84139 RepID=UPI003BB5BBAE